MQFQVHLHTDSGLLLTISKVGKKQDLTPEKTTGLEAYKFALNCLEEYAKTSEEDLSRIRFYLVRRKETDYLLEEVNLTKITQFVRGLISK